jgi:hypothetical protein
LRPPIFGTARVPGQGLKTCDGGCQLPL